MNYPFNLTNSIINNLTDGVFNATSTDNGPGLSSFGIGTNAFNNAGIFTKLGSGNLPFNVPFNNSGTIGVQEDF